MPRKSQHTVKELRNLAKAAYAGGKGNQALKGYSKMRKPALEDALGISKEVRGKRVTTKKYSTAKPSLTAKRYESAKASKAIAYALKKKMGLSDKSTGEIHSQLRDGIKKAVDKLRRKKPDASDTQVRAVALGAVQNTISKLKAEQKQSQFSTSKSRNSMQSQPFKSKEQSIDPSTSKKQRSQPGTTQKKSRQERKAIERDTEASDSPAMAPSVRRFSHTTEIRESDVNSWTEAFDNLDTSLLDDETRDRFIDNVPIGESIIELARLRPETFRGVRDRNGNLQSAAIVNLKPQENDDHLNVSFLATAPWNVVGGTPQSVRGAGKAMMVNLINESKARGHDGRIRLDPLEGAVSFYKKVGFVHEPDGEMVLHPDKAEEFLKSNGGMVLHPNKADQFLESMRD